PVAPEREWTDLHVLFSPGGDSVLTSTGYGSFRLWRAADGRPLGQLTPPGKIQLSCVAFSPDGRLVVAGHEDGTAQRWEWATSPPLGAPAVQPLGVIGVTFDSKGRSFVTVAADGTVRRWPVPTPLEGSIERIARSVQLSTGLRLDEGRAVVPLTRQEWEELRQDWRGREGQADWAIRAPIGDDDWHDARAHDADQTGQWYTARWHLNRLLAHKPGDWKTLVRRARTYSAEGKWDRAEADYRRAAKQATVEEMLAWY